MKICKTQWLIPLEESTDQSVFLFTACDSKYLGYAISLIRSADLFSPGFSFVLHLINPSRESLDRIQSFSESLNDTRLNVSYEHINLSALNEEQKRTYFASARFPQIRELLKQFQKPVFSLDADSLVVNPIDLNFSDKAGAEIVIIRRNLFDKMPEHLSVATGSIWLKPTQNVSEFLNRVSQQIDERLQNRSLRWFDDQVFFFRQMQEMQKEIRFFNLKRKYADWDFNENSIIWAGKGPRKENDMRFFLLHAFLSDDDVRRSLANRIWSNLCESGGELSTNGWLRDRLTNARKSTSVERVALYFPRLDLPWKPLKKLSTSIPLLDEDVLELRLYWKHFVVRLANVIERAGVSVDVIEIPAWEINRKTIDTNGASLALVPHRCMKDFEDGVTPVRFYMQEYFRWVFVVDKSGWSAASSAYPLDLETLPVIVDDSFSIYRQRLLAGSLDSKFAQPVHKNQSQLITEGSIPVRGDNLRLHQVRPYIFLPLQIPHDQSIRYFSDFTEQEVVNALVDWVCKHDIALVMKPHPANRKSMAPFKALVDERNVFWSEANVYDLIAYATAVYTINSGVGFESLFHLKPVVTFGRVEYDCISFRATLDTMDAAWDYCLQADASILENRYRRFINWFLRDYAVDLSQPKFALERMEQIVADIVAQIRLTKNGNPPVLPGRQPKFDIQRSPLGHTRS